MTCTTSILSAIAAFLAVEDHYDRDGFITTFPLAFTAASPRARFVVEMTEGGLQLHSTAFHVAVDSQTLEVHRMVTLCAAWPRSGGRLW